MAVWRTPVTQTHVTAATKRPVTLALVIWAGAAVSVVAHVAAGVVVAHVAAAGVVMAGVAAVGGAAAGAAAGGVAAEAAVLPRETLVSQGATSAAGVLVMTATGA